ncbi:hypothetical protein AB1N83_012150 [Pleurotus pulmonarius]
MMLTVARATTSNETSHVCILTCIASAAITRIVGCPPPTATSSGIQGISSTWSTPPSPASPKPTAPIAITLGVRKIDIYNGLKHIYTQGHCHCGAHQLSTCPLGLIVLLGKAVQTVPLHVSQSIAQVALRIRVYNWTKYSTLRFDAPSLALSILLFLLYANRQLQPRGTTSYSVPNNKRVVCNHPEPQLHPSVTTCHGLSRVAYCQCTTLDFYTIRFYGDAESVHGRCAFFPPIGHSVRLKNTNGVKTRSQDAKNILL